ncbi:MAG: cyclase family protein [Terriglobia bacterium]
MEAFEDLLRSVEALRCVDLTQALEEHMPHYPTHSKFHHTLWNSYWHGDRSLTYQLLMNEHSGTHVDAPAHFISDANPAAHVTIDQVPVRTLIGRGVRLDCRHFKAGESVPRSFLTDWEASHGPLREKDIVLFNFGWSAHWSLRPQHAAYVSDWPAVGMDAAQYLLGKRAAAIGVDTLSPDHPAALAGAPIHPVVLEKQMLLIENLCNLDLLPNAFLFLALPLRIRGGSGSPLRAVGLF